MKIRSILFSLLGALPVQSYAIEVIEPQELQTSAITLSDPDQHIATLGAVSFRIDLSAAHDDLLALKVRRSALTLFDGRPFTAFGVHKGAGIIVLAAGDVRHVSIASVDGTQDARAAHVLFYDQDNKVISPKSRDVAVYSADFKPLVFFYKPLKIYGQAPGALDIPVTIALDISGSMAGHMNTVVAATRSFMKELPAFTRCRLLTFSDDVRTLTPSSYERLTSCPSSSYLLSAPLQAGGLTALYKAIETGFKGAPSDHTFPNIVIVVTDGVNTSPFSGSLSSLRAQKALGPSRLFVFWAGSYQKDHLQGLADLELVSAHNLKSELEAFFRSLGVSLSGLQTLHIGK